VVVRHDHGIGAESRGRAEDRAGVMRIGDLIEHEYNAASRYDVRNVDGLDRQGFEHDALVHGAGAEAASNVSGLDDVGAKTSTRNFAFEPPGGSCRGINIEEFSPFAAQRLAHRVKAVKNRNAAGRASEPGRLGPREIFLAGPWIGRTKQLVPAFIWGDLARRRIRHFAVLAGGVCPRP
jgi:hypothetical protein